MSWAGRVPERGGEGRLRSLPATQPVRAWIAATARGEAKRKSRRRGRRRLLNGGSCVTAGKGVSRRVQGLRRRSASGRGRRSAHSRGCGGALPGRYRRERGARRSRTPLPQRGCGTGRSNCRLFLQPTCIGRRAEVEDQSWRCLPLFRRTHHPAGGKALAPLRSGHVIARGCHRTKLCKNAGGMTATRHEKFFL